jgi:Domain of unknown function (DUF4430)
VTSRFAAWVGAIASALALAGCGLGAGPGTSNVSLTVTRDFGAHRVAAINRGRVPGSETVMRMLERSFRIGTRYGGGFVESINGLSGDADRRDWFYYVNGTMATVGAAQQAVHRGDRIWWDLHSWLAPEQPQAVVGSYPEPFLHGAGGKRFPTTLECADDVSEACRRVGAALGALGVPVASQTLGGGGSGTDSIAVLVGTWKDLRPSDAGAFIAKGPASSGIYARFSGRRLELLNAQGQVSRTLTSGAGLIAATAQSSGPPTWLITGTDVAGVAAAASSLSETSLRNHFALAVQGGQRLPVPQ